MRSVLQLCFMLLMLLGATLGAGNRAWSSVRCTYAYDAAGHRTGKVVVGNSDLYAVTHGCSLANLLPVGEHADSPDTSPKRPAWTYDAQGLHIIKRDIGTPCGGPNRPSATAVVIAYQWDAQHPLCIVWMQIGPNVYAYVMQNPWTAFDPHGLASVRILYQKNKKYVEKVLNNPTREKLEETISKLPNRSVKAIEFAGHANKHQIN